MAHRIPRGVAALAAVLAALGLAACGDRTDTDSLAEREAANRDQAAQVRITPDDNRSTGEVETFEGTPRTAAGMGAPAGRSPDGDDA